MGIGENVFGRNGDSMSVDTLLVWWQGKNCKYAWQADTSYNKISGRTNVRAGEKSNTVYRQ